MNKAFIRTVLARADIEPSAKLVLLTMALLARDGVASLSKRELAEMTALSESTVKRAASCLIGLGAVEAERPLDEAGANLPTQYRVL